MIITIDGPAGSGKSTIARAVADELGWMFLDTGAMYRAVALLARRAGLGVERANQIAELAREARIAFERTDSLLKVFLNDEDVTDPVRTEGVSEFASKISAIPEVRAVLVDKQRELASRYGHVVTEGRDQGSVVFPHAELKVYLDADVAERARRRYEQLGGQGQAADYEKILAALKERDRRDQTRAASPLVVPERAVVIDTTRMTPGEVLDRILQLARQAEQEKSPPRHQDTKEGETKSL